MPPRPPVAKLLRPDLRAFRVPEYPPEARGAARMDANTNLFGVNPALRAAALGKLDPAQYPSGNSDPLRDDLAAFGKVTRDRVVVGNGSDELLDLVTKAFVAPGDRVAFAVPSFVMYPFYGRVNHGAPVAVPLKRTPPVGALRPGSGPAGGPSHRGSRRPSFALDVARLLAARAKVTIVASPNSPTGGAFPAADLERLVRGAAGIVVIDEAYAEFCGQDWIARTAEFDRLLVLRTFSKAHGLAGLRVGYAIGSPAVVDAVLRVKPPFNVGVFAEAAARAALADRRFMEKTVRVIRAERERIATALEAAGLTVFASDANFLLVDTGRPSRRIADALARKRILVRHMTDFAGLETCIRVTLGPPAINDRFLNAIKDGG